jgi:predicted GTPase
MDFDQSETKTGPGERGLQAVAQVARERGDSGIVAEAGEALESLAAGQFHVAFVGQFKRGKSTLINALLGRELLPADVPPLTSAISIVQFGPVERFTVHYEDGRLETIQTEEIARFASEEGNPRNSRGVRAVVLDLPHSFLEGGLRLVDTPGLGSVFTANSEVTGSFLPKIDVALVVLGCDPPMTGEELNLIRSVRDRSARICFILNKVDQATPEMIRKAEAFTRRVLREDLGQEPGEFILASAKKALLGNDDPGMRELKALLQTLASRSREALARQSAARTVSHLARRLLQQIELEQAGLLAPIAELDEKISRFQAAMQDIRDLGLAAQTRVKSEPTEDWKAWQAKKESFIESELKRILPAVEAAGGKAGESARRIRRAARECSRQQARNSVERWLALTREHFAGQAGALAGRVDAEVNRLVGRVSEAASSCFGIQVERFELKGLLVPQEEIPFDFVETKLALDINDWLIPVLDLFSPRNLTIRRAARRAGNLAREWLARNLYQIDEHLLDWTDRLVRQLFAAMDQRLEALSQEVLAAVETGRRSRQEGETAIAAKLALLHQQRNLLESALENLPLPGN